MPKGQIGPYPAPSGEPVAYDGGRLSLESDGVQVTYLAVYGGDPLRAAAAYVQDRNLTIQSSQPLPANWMPLYSGITALPATTAPMIQNCASCATGNNTGACSGCAPTTPPGYVTTGSGVPVSTSSGLPFGFNPSSPVSIVGVKLPAWIWGAGLAAGYFALKSRGRR